MHKKLKARAQQEKEERVLFKQKAAAAAKAAAAGGCLSWGVCTRGRVCPRCCLVKNRGQVLVLGHTVQFSTSLNHSSVCLRYCVSNTSLAPG
jgi:hypothetical protein